MNSVLVEKAQYCRRAKDYELKELKTGKCIDLLGFVREMFINESKALTQSLLQMANVTSSG